MVQRTAGGRTPAALAISAPDGRLTEERLPEFVQALSQVTSEVVRHLV